jgi:hypothetical protein
MDDIIMADDFREAGKYDEYSHRAMKMREGMERPNLDKSGKRIGESTHIMATEKIDDRWVSFPTLFPHKEKPNRWIDYDKGGDTYGAYEEAGRRGERFEFGQDKESALKFGKGSWKSK